MDRRMRWNLVRSGLFGSALLLMIAGGLTVGCHTPVAVEAPRMPVAGTSTVVRLRPGLVINFTLLLGGKKEFTETSMRVTEEGMIALPLLGLRCVKDQTLSQLRDQLTDAYGRFYVNPQVVVEFDRDEGPDAISPWGYVTVLGRVRNPGRISLPATRDMTVSGAIQKAGGFGSSANVDGILVTRRCGADRTETRIVSLHAVGDGTKVDDDLMLQSEDVVYVPEARF